MAPIIPLLKGGVAEPSKQIQRYLSQGEAGEVIDGQAPVLLPPLVAPIALR